LDFLLALKETARQKMESLPLPSPQDEEWRRTPPNLFPLYPPVAQSDALHIGWQIPDAMASDGGVVLLDLKTAIQNFPDWAAQHLCQTGEWSGLKRFAAQHQAFFQDGLCLWVKRGVRIQEPLIGRIELKSAEGAVFPHLLIVVEEAAEVTFWDERCSSPLSHCQTIFSNEMVEIFIGPKATLRYIHLQRWDPSVSEIFLQKTFVGEEAQFMNVALGLGGSCTKAHLETILNAQGGRADLLGIWIGTDDRHVDIHTLQDHKAPRTSSDLLYKNALKDRSKTIHTGLIRIARSAKQANAYQANRNLLLSEGAKADSIPMLEIEADDVRCTHGVAVGPVDEEQRFYLTSRGLTEAEAERLIVQGFFDPILQRLPTETMRETLADEILNRLQQKESDHAAVG
jgi:Fe-S cluster assembly protein SufD